VKGYIFLQRKYRRCGMPSLAKQRLWILLLSIISFYGHIPGREEYFLN